MKKQLILTLSSLLILSACSLTGIGINQNINNKAENQEEEDTGTVILPTLPTDAEGEMNSFSKMSNNLLNAKGLDFSQLSLVITTTSSKPLTLKFTDLIIDMTDSSSLDFNMSALLNVLYEGIDEKINFNMEKDGYAYLSLVNHSFESQKLKVSAPETLDDLLSLLKTLGISLPSSSSLESVKLDSFISKAKETVNNIQESDNANFGKDYTLTIPSFEINSTKVDAFSLVLSSTSDNQLSGIKTSDSISFDDKTHISVNGLCSVEDTSSYQKVDSSSYQDMTHASESVLSTITKVIDKKKADINIDMSLLTPSGNVSKVEGLMKADVSQVASDLTKGTYSLFLDHKAYSGSTTNDSLALFFDYPIAYIDLNDSQFKGKIKDAELKDIFSYISEMTGNSTSEGIADELTSILGECAFTSLLKGDYSKYRDFVTDFSYVTDESFTLELSSLAFGLGDSSLDVKNEKNLIKISVNFNSDKTSSSYGLTDITVKNLSYKNYVVESLSLSIDDFTGISVPGTDSSYKDYGGIVPIFKTVSELASSKKVSASYSLNYNDSTNSNLYVISGDIDADLSAISSFNALSLDTLKNGNYHLSLNTNQKKGDESCDNKVEVFYQDKNIYLGYNNGLNLGNTVLKNYITDSSVSDIKTVIDTKAPSSANPLDSMNDIINAIKNSDPLKSDINLIKEGYLSSLKSILSIDKDNSDPSKLVIVLDTIKVLANTDYANRVGSITLTVDCDDISLESINVSTYINKEGNTLSFSLSLKDYADCFNQKTGYTQITSAAVLLESFYNLPNFSADQYGIGVNASLKTVGSDSTTLINGSAAVNGSKESIPSMYGAMTLNLPNLNKGESNVDHKVEFNYDSSIGEVTADYNDKMHVIMHKNKIEDIFTSLKGITNDTNLLYRYLKVLNSTSSGIPLMDCISNKDPSQLLFYPFIKKVEFGDNALTLTVDSRIFNGDADIDNPDDSTRTDTIVVNFDSAKKEITSVSIDAYMTSMSTDTIGNTTYSTKHIVASISLLEYASVSVPDLLSYTGNEDSFINLDNFSTLVDCLIDNTESNYFHIEGSFTINIKVLALFTLKDTTINIDARIYIKDEHAYAYILFNNNDSIFVEIFISEKEVLMAKTTDSSTEYFKTTQENVLKNVAYYIFTYIIDIDSMSFGKLAAANIYNGVSGSDSSATLNNDFSGLIKSAKLNGNSFDLNVNLADFVTVSGVSFPDSVNLHIGYKDNGNGYTPLTTLTVDKCSLSAYAVVTVNISGSASLTDLSVSPINLSSDTVFSSSEYMKRYSDFVTQFKNDYGEFTDTSKLPYYSIDGYTIKKNWLGMISNYSLQDNASSAKKTASSGSVYYYEH